MFLYTVRVPIAGYIDVECSSETQLTEQQACEAALLTAEAVGSNLPPTYCPYEKVFLLKENLPIPLIPYVREGQVQED